MMANNISAVESYIFSSEDELFFDTNVWIFIYGPQKPGDKRAAIYSNAFAKILAAESHIYIDVLIVSEFINTYARLKWNVMNKPHGDFKQFRKSAAFKPIARDIAADVKRILKQCARVENGFEALDINVLINEYAVGNSDFNDQVIAAFCKRKGLILITDDRDFIAKGIQVLTNI